MAAGSRTRAPSRSCPATWRRSGTARSLIARVLEGVQDDEDHEKQVRRTQHIGDRMHRGRLQHGLRIFLLDEVRRDLGDRESRCLPLDPVRTTSSTTVARPSTSASSAAMSRELGVAENVRSSVRSSGTPSAEHLRGGQRTGSPRKVRIVTANSTGFSIGRTTRRRIVIPRRPCCVPPRWSAGPPWPGRWRRTAGGSWWWPGHHDDDGGEAAEPVRIHPGNSPCRKPVTIPSAL